MSPDFDAYRSALYDAWLVSDDEDAEFGEVIAAATAHELSRIAATLERIADHVVGSDLLDGISTVDLSSINGDCIREAGGSR